jgi:hypothetical protein
VIEQAAFDIFSKQRLNVARVERPQLNHDTPLSIIA